MAPEQARGKPVDKRADIWAFGVVVYELLTGEQLHKGETLTDTLAAVLTLEPDWNKVPPQFRVLLKRCLEKDPKKRLRDIGDAMPLIGTKEIGTKEIGNKEIANEDTAAAGTRRSSRLGWMPWAVAAVFALAALALAAIH